MFESLRNAWKITELRKKILYTLFMLLIYRLLCFIPTPGINAASVSGKLSLSADIFHTAVCSGYCCKSGCPAA